ncbi:hypothetical protein BASA50_000051 [Batrachochytrium salamandrivorans]|uniref:Mini-chromosome maintenance complex-binding protein n=1 Tax=Batrachochytrium salamandrivorans TaxID=1357716 RepID=A0ABQ8EV37_9FUNG|nr:hypothetical protein BASA50_000051 [Batrachochytrium salamandrivorans]
MHNGRNHRSPSSPAAALEEEEENEMALIQPIYNATNNSEGDRAMMDADTMDLQNIVKEPLVLVEELLSPSRRNCLQEQQQPAFSAESALQGSHSIVHSHIAALAQTTSLLQMVPDLTVGNQTTLPNNSLVRFRCMVQDNSVPFETYPSECTVRHATTGEEYPWLLCLDNMSDLGKFSEKQPHFCVAVPGEAEWVKHDYRSPSSEYPELSMSLSGMAISDGDSTALSKTESTDACHHLAVCSDGIKTFNTLMKNKMGHGDPVHAVMVKTYGAEDFQLNEVVEVIGILNNTKLDPIEDKELLDEMPLSSMIPCIHVILAQKLDGKTVNPIIRHNTLPMPKFSDVAPALRQAAIDHLQGHLMGDALAAEYIFLQMFSRITNRAGGIFPVGYFPINLCHAPPFSTGFASSLMGAILHYVPHGHLLPMTLDTLNTGLWVDPDQARHHDNDAINSFTQDLGLCAGALQLQSSTVLVLDESSLTDGTLVDRGVRNIKSLDATIQNAELSFGVGLGGSIQRPVDYRIVVVSEGKSMFKGLCSLPIQANPNGPCHTPMPTQQQMFQLRMMIEELKYSEPDLLPGTDERIQREFTESRTAARKSSLPVDDGTLLLQRLNLAQLVCRSYGLSQVDDAGWEHSGRLESARLARCASAFNKTTLTAK